MASVKQGDFSEVQRDAARDEFFRLLRTHPALEEVYKLKRAKKLPLTDFDIEQAKEKDPSIDVHEVVDVYEKAHFPASPASSGSDDTENTEDKEEKKKDDKEGNDEDYDGDADERVEESVEKASNDGGRQENISPESISGMRVVAKGDGASEKGEEIPAEGRQKTINADVKNKGTVKSNGFGEENVGESSEEEGGEKDGEGDEGKKSEESKRGSSHKFNVGSLNKESREKIEGLMRKYHVSTGEDGKTEAPGYAELATPFLSSPATRMGRSRRQEGERRGGFDTARKARRAWRLGKKVKGSGFLSKMLRPSARNLIQGVARVVSLLPGGKVVLIVIGAIILLLIIAFLIINKSSGDFVPSEDEAPDTTTPSQPDADTPDPNKPFPGLSITLTEPEPVPAGSEVTVPIEVTYSGSQEVEVIAGIPEGANFVSATGNYQLLGDLISWRLSTNAPTSTTEGSNEVPSGVTIHDLGFGSSDGDRIDNFIREIRPNSPMLGQGDYIVELAQEFGIDPLMIVVTINESQMCSDNGVVSPGGSDPDNYNCGGILWNTVTGTAGVDVDRWSISAGPVANGHVFAYVPTVQDGLGLFFNYLGVSTVFDGLTFEKFYARYNPCDDPGNQGRFACGEDHAREMLELLAEYVGGSTTRTYDFSFTIEAADGENLTVQDYVVSGRVVDGSGDSINF